MKIKNLVLFATSTVTAYKFIKNHEQIRQGIGESVTTVRTLKSESENLKNNLNRVQTESAHLQEVVKDINYEITTFNKVLQARLSEIQAIWNK